MPSEPWYQDGLRFECTGCGDCCSGAPGVVWVNASEIAALAERMSLDVETFEARFVRKVGRRKSLKEFDNGDCVFLDPTSRKCTVYDLRPEQCRTWPFWESNISSPEAWRLTCEVCPGSGKGALVPVEEVLRQSRVIRL